MPSRLAVVIALASALGCAPSKAERCERYADEGLGLVLGVAGGVSKGLGGDGDVTLSDAERKLVRDKAVGECMTWPDDFVRCVSGGDWESVACREAYAKKEGLVVRVDGVAGPKPETRVVARDGALACYAGSCLFAGETLQDLEGRGVGAGSVIGAVMLGGKHAFLVAKEEEMTLLGAGGASATAIPAPRPAPDDPLARPLATSASDLVLFDDQRVRKLLAPPCESCFEATPWRIDGFYISSLDQPGISELDGGLLYRDSDHLRSYGADGALRFALNQQDIGEPLIADKVVYLTAGKEALALDLAHCAGDAPRALAELSAPCVRGRFELPETSYARPGRLGAAVYFLADGRIYQMIDGRRGWVAEVEADAMLTLEEGGKRVIFATSYWTYDHPAQLLALAPDSGKTLMQVDLVSEQNFSGADLQRHQSRLLANVTDRLFSWEIATLLAALP